MALARIFSRYPEQTTTLSQQLLQQGYKVEVLSPDEAPATLADLEIQLEVCDPAEVLLRAAELAERLNADIAVAPGALVTAPPEAPAAVQESTPPPRTLAVTAATPEPAIKAAAMEIRSDAAPATARPNRMAQAARTSGAAVAACVAGVGALLAFARAEFRENLERARLRAAEARERREGRLLELTRRRAEAARQAAALEGLRRAAAVVLQWQHESAQVPDSGRMRAPVNEPSDVKILRIRWRKWEAALAGAVAAAALFVAGLAVASFHSRPMLSANRDVALPSGGVTPQALQAKPAPARTSPVLRKTTPKPAARARQVQHKAPQRKQEMVASDVVVRRFATPKPTPHTQADGWKHFSDTSN